MRSLWRVRVLWFTVTLTLALGIGANAAIFSVVRAVLLRPLENQDEDRLLYLHQGAPGINENNAAFSVPEIQDIGSKLKSIKELGTLSEIDFTLVGLGTPREIPLCISGILRHLRCTDSGWPRFQRRRQERFRTRRHHQPEPGESSLSRPESA